MYRDIALWDAETTIPYPRAVKYQWDITYQWRGKVVRSILAGSAGLILILTVLWDSFETIVLPRRVVSRLRLARLFYRLVWAPWSATAHRLRNANRRENYLSYFGPLSQIMLLGLWASGLIVGFALLQWAIGSQFSTPNGVASFASDLYVSGSMFFTLGISDIVPSASLARILAIMEGGVGFGFLAMIISYLPAMNGAFSRREVDVSLLDERAGSPPSAIELLRREAEHGTSGGVEQFLHEWERWSAELLEIHLSYPVLGYFRSQHENQSWLAALTMVLDLSTLALVGIEGVQDWPAQLTFAMARHTAVDLSQVLGVPPCLPGEERLPYDQLKRLRAELASSGARMRTDTEADRRLNELRAMYEPYVCALSRHLLMDLPPWVPADSRRDNWQTTAWELHEREHP
jgi:hypothetical protein